MNQRFKELLQHTLGADERYLKKQWGFRNRFVGNDGLSQIGAVKYSITLYINDIVFYYT